MKKVICIMGPTASGKTKLSIVLANHLGGEIINGDSVAIYKELNIGSAKIKHEEMAGIRHHLLSVSDLDHGYTVYNFQKDCRKIIQNIKYPIIVGGSGLYIKSALYDYRFESNESSNLLSIDEMINYIQTHDPNLILDWKNDRRIISAYKNILNGQKPSLNTYKDQSLYDIHLIYLDLDKTKLKEKLIIRLDQMIKDGFIEETKKLINYPLNIIGYREIKSYLEGNMSLDDAKNQIIQVTLKYAKRQKTWFLNQMKPHIYDASSQTLFEDVLKDVDIFLRGDV